MKHWMFSCNEVSQKVSQSIDESLPFHQRMAVWMHLLMCRFCLRFRNQLMILGKLGRMTAHESQDGQPLAALSAEARERIKDKLNAVSNNI